MTRHPKFLIVGQWMWPWYQEACATALEKIGCRVERFSWFHDFYCWKSTKTEPVYKSAWVALQNRLLFGPALRRLNDCLLQTARQSSPDVVWFYNCTHIFPKTVKELRQSLPNTVLVQYTNDDPFGRHIKPDYWRHLKKAIPFFDIHFIYRQSNKSDFEQAGARVTRLLRSYYIPGEDYRVPLGEADRSYLSEVVFAGHYEADGRLELLGAIAGAGYRLNLFGGGWDRTEKRLSPKSALKPLFPVSPVTGEDYRKAISGAKIALCFLSKINNDTYTRRNFQIPAMQAFMLSEYSEDLANLFEEGTEAEYFRTREELLDKVAFYLTNDTAREKIAERGHEKLLRGGHDVTSRMQEFLEEVIKLKDELGPLRGK